jgi:hypothetical protein
MKANAQFEARRVVLVHWKQNRLKPFEVYSNLKNFSLAHPEYSYDTLNNYLSKKKLPFETEEVRVERKHIITTPEKSKPNLHKRLFWELDYEHLDWQKNAEIVVERVVERGTLEEWLEMVNFYGRKKVLSILKNKTTYLTDRAVKKVCDYFQLKPEELRCYIRKQSQPQHWI